MRPVSKLQLLRAHRAELESCSLCPQMVGPVVAPPPVLSKILLLGQAPGPHEGRIGRPFAWTAGKTLFRWFATLGVSEETFRSRIYMAAVCRCFPGKNPNGGDRVPDSQEILHCSRWLRSEVELLEPELLLPVCKLAIQQLLPVKRLADVVGQQFSLELFGRTLDVLPLPHPSGASTWHRTSPGIELLEQALALIAQHPIFATTVAPPAKAAASGD
ncbi:MAG: uracil-DNA glycosylase family protein [Acidobacteriota bacterium]